MCPKIIFINTFGGIHSKYERSKYNNFFHVTRLKELCSNRKLHEGKRKFKVPNFKFSSVCTCTVQTYFVHSINCTVLKSLLPMYLQYFSEKWETMNWQKSEQKEWQSCRLWQDLIQDLNIVAKFLIRCRINKRLSVR